jgi:acetyltransferase-like isoleucine patch superfamily enzyme
MEPSIQDRTPTPDSCSDHTAMTPQQRRLASGNSRLKTYKDLMVGGSGWATWLGFEAYNLLLCNLGSALGMGLRSLTLPFFFKQFGKGTIFGRGVTIRQPFEISIGRAVIVDDYAVIDMRPNPYPTPTARSGIEIDDKVFIGRNSIVTTKGGYLSLGKGCNISTNCRIATASSLEIGESVLIAAFVYIGCANHSFKDASRPIIEQDMEFKGGVKIGANVWIGTHSTILDGVTIGENAIVGAHSLVKDNVPANAIVAGTPAKLIRMRS